MGCGFCYEYQLSERVQQRLAYINIYSMSVEDSNPRLSAVADYTQGNNEIYPSMFRLSYLNSGDQTAHGKNTHDFMVLDKKWLSETQFEQVYNLCYNLPGPTTSQVIITIVILKLKSISVAINAFLVYSIIPFMVLTVLGILASVFLSGDEKEFSMPVRMALMGCTAASAGIMVRSFYKYFTTEASTIPKKVWVLLTAGIFYIYKSQNAIIFCLSLGAIVSLYLQGENEGTKKMSSKSQTLFSKLKFNFLLGKPSLVILVGIFCLLWIFFSINSDSNYEYIFSFYWIGCFIIGPIEVIFAYLLSIMFENPAINLTQMWIGVAFGFLIPGSHLNIGIYFGFLLDGLKGASLAAISLYIPCFLFLLGMLPQWKYYREKGGIKRIYQGLICSTTGLTLSVIILIMEHCMELNLACAVCIFVICAVVNCFLNRYAFMTILIGGALAYTRHIGYYCYREGTYCPFPFNF